MEIRIGVTNLRPKEINAHLGVCKNGIVLRTNEGGDESPMGMALTFLGQGISRDDDEIDHDGLA